MLSQIYLSYVTLKQVSVVSGKFRKTKLKASFTAGFVEPGTFVLPVSGAYTSPFSTHKSSWSNTCCVPAQRCSDLLWCGCYHCKQLLCGFQ